MYLFRVIIRGFSKSINNYFQLFSKGSHKPLRCNEKMLRFFFTLLARMTYDRGRQEKIMCINQGLDLLSEWFENNDSFRFKKDYKSLNWDSLRENKSNDEEEESCILSSLSVFEEEKIIKFAESASGEDTWVIQNSRITSPREIHLTPQTCKNISTVVNGYLPLLDLNIDQKSDERNIGEADIIILLSVIQAFAKQLDEVKKSKGPTKKK